MTYVRPDLDLEVFLDGSGVPINYGRRWGMDSPPEDLYSVCAHPQRFAPLAVVARALVDHLIDAYDVDVADTAALPGYLEAAEIGSESYPVSVTLLTPKDSEAAPLTVVETAFPGVHVLAGAAGDHPFPACGCDACDDDVLDVAEELERLVFAVVGGRYQEKLTSRKVTRGWFDDHGSQESEMPRRVAEQEEVTALIRARRHLGAQWAPWTLR